jgi:hypothetical protein
MNQRFFTGGSTLHRDAKASWLFPSFWGIEKDHFGDPWANPSIWQQNLQPGFVLTVEQAKWWNAGLHFGEAKGIQKSQSIFMKYTDHTQAHQTIEKNNRHGTSCNRLIAIPNRTVFEYQSICLLLCLHIGYQALAELLSCYLKSSFMVHRNGCYRQQTMSRLAEETQKWTQRTYCKKSFFYPRTTQVTSDWVWGDFLQCVPALLLSNPAPCFL